MSDIGSQLYPLNIIEDQQQLSVLVTLYEEILFIVEFFSENCFPCTRIESSLKELQAKHPKCILIGKVDVDKSKNLCAAATISHIPTFHLFYRGVLVNCIVGANFDSLRYAVEVFINDHLLPSGNSENSVCVEWRSLELNSDVSSAYLYLVKVLFSLKKITNSFFALVVQVLQDSTENPSSCEGCCSSSSSDGEEMEDSNENIPLNNVKNSSDLGRQRRVYVQSLNIHDWSLSTVFELSFIADICEESFKAVALPDGEGFLCVQLSISNWFVCIVRAMVPSWEFQWLWNRENALSHKLQNEEQKVLPQICHGHRLGFSLSAVSINGRTHPLLVLFGGGCSRRGEVMEDLCLFDLEKNSWKRPNIIGKGPCARRFHCALSPKANSLVVFGGEASARDDFREFNDIFLLDLDFHNAVTEEEIEVMVTWRTLEVYGVVPSARVHCLCIGSSEKILVFGGLHNDRPLGLCEDSSYALFDLQTTRWERVIIHKVTSSRVEDFPLVSSDLASALLIAHTKETETTAKHKVFVLGGNEWQLQSENKLQKRECMNRHLSFGFLSLERF